MYDFLFDYNAIDKSEILSIHEYLMVNPIQDGGQKASSPYQFFPFNLYKRGK